MRTIKLLVLSVVLTTDLSAQQVITVRPQHSKKLIRTLDKEEFLTRGESHINLRFDGEDYEYITYHSAKRMYQHYKDARFIEAAPYPAIFREIKHCYTLQELVGDKYLTVAVVNGKRIGPYEELSVDRFFDYETNKLYGYSYRDNGRYYVKDETRGKLYGPYDQFRRQDNRAFYFSYQKAGSWYVHDGTKDYGPFEDVQTVNSSQDKNGLIFSYKQSGAWMVHCKDSVPYRFSEKPFFSYDPNGKWKILGIPVDSGNRSWLLSQDGGKWEHRTTHQLIWSTGNEPLVATTMSSFSGKDENFTGWFAPYLMSGGWYNIHLGNQLIGTFQARTILPSPVPSPYYPVVLFKKTEGSEFVDGSRFYLYKSGVGLVEVPSDGLKTIALCGDSYHYIAGEDKVLYTDGRATKHKQVLKIDFSSFPKSWYMVKQEGYYAEYYKNGVRDNSTESKEKWVYGWFDTRDKPCIFIQKDDKTYAKVPTSTKLFGPVKARSVMAFSKNNEHYAEGDERGNQVLIDGKVISTGYALIYNPTKNAFHWISQDGQKLYFHTYELD
jgi:hypothetical protein